MKITSAEYITSFPRITEFDLTPLPSIAFIGRSNVGKSSLINHLVNRKKLVKTSSTPGKTQLINYFLINEQFYFVDLPGYGFANVPVKVKNSWRGMIEEFLLTCPQLALIVQLVDIRHKPSREDVEFQELLRRYKLTNLVIANKADKIKKNQIQKSQKIIKEILGVRSKPIVHSALKKIGHQEIWNQFTPYVVPQHEGELPVQ
ncbi:MAG: YihA family ribosome biogenesis GTP-binding protein [SAR324 cluster bacterium]|uniref:Probable GTP-binding protein EngB n=1 Tax=SAR324 cluster bacterium TaxID=2024889 RepID=A0A2A4SVS0_9DELT|nr:MAG: YihA family ribosome biogenesis GTP-binding protein [SAR324 cluster bacterium]